MFWWSNIDFSRQVQEIGAVLRGRTDFVACAVLWLGRSESWLLDMWLVLIYRRKPRAKAAFWHVVFTSSLAATRGAVLCGP